jgi:hypothetical protein
LTDDRDVRDLGQIIEGIRPLVADSSRPTKQRIRILWAAAKKVRELGKAEPIHCAFMALATQAHLIDSRGRWVGPDVVEHIHRHGREDVAHVISWALRGWNPFERGALK